MYLTEKSSKTYYTLFKSLVLRGSKTQHKTKRIIFPVTSFLKTYWKYYNLYNVFIVQPNQMTYTNLDWTEKTRF